MYSACWQSDLLQALHCAQPADRLCRVTVVGIGHEFGGDDAIGVQVARGSRHRVLPANWAAIDAGPVPESCTGPLRRFHSDLVVLVDATQSGVTPGGVRWLDRWEADAAGVSTHTLPLTVLANYLRSELGCAVGLLGIQPTTNILDLPRSPAVLKAATEIIDGLDALLISASAAG
jgi:hydrogenase 3 maturation protease